jgi:hypothetical protein
LAKRNFPTSGKEFDAWFSKFNTAFTKHGSKFGFTTTDKKAMTFAFKNWHSSWNTYNKFQEFFNFWNAYYNWSRKNTESFVLYYINRIQNNKSVPGNWGSVFGFGGTTTRGGKTTGTRKGVGTKTRTTTVSKSRTTKKGTKTTPKLTGPRFTPTLTFDWTKPGQVYLYSSTNGRKMSKFPSGVKSVWFEFRLPGGTWKYLTNSTNPNFVHAVGSNNNKKFQYRACFVGSTGVKGPWSRVISVSYQKKAA